MLYLFLALVLWLVLPPAVRKVRAWKQMNMAERSFTIRFAAFSLLLVFVFMAAVVLLPNKGRVIMAVPVFLAAATLTKWWHTSRHRLRKQAQEDSTFARARRIN